MLHGYCIRLATDAGPPEGLAGVAGAPVRTVAAEGLSIWVSETSEVPPAPERLRQHERVVRSALRTATPLPLRYGTLFRDEAAAMRALEQRGDEFRRMLRELEGHVEMGMRISAAPGGRKEPVAARRATPDPGSLVGPDPSHRELSPGRAYLASRRQALEAKAAAREEMESHLDALEVALAHNGWKCVRAVLPGDPPTGSLAHLVHRAELSSYRDRVSALQIDNPHLRIAVSGPWAPYSFVR